MNELCLNLLAPSFKLCTILLVLMSHTNFKLMISQERIRISIVKYLVQDKTLVSCNLWLELSLMWIGFWFFFMFEKVYFHGVILESHFLSFKRNRLQTTWIQVQNTQNNDLFVNLCACFYMYDFVSFDNVGCQSCNVYAQHYHQRTF